MKSVFFIGLLSISLSVISCPVAIPGWNWTKDELIEKSSSIVLAKFILNGDTPKWEIEEILRGEASKSYLNTFLWYRTIATRVSQKGLISYSGNDFSGHNLKEFWQGNAGRSGPPKSVCFMPHLFKNGETYLLFDKPVNTFSAELIKSRQDSWYEYVKKLITSQGSKGASRRDAVTGAPA